MGKANLQPAVQALVEASIGYLESSPRMALRSIWFLAYDPKEYAALVSVFDEDPRITPINEKGEIAAK